MSARAYISVVAACLLLVTCGDKITVNGPAGNNNQATPNNRILGVTVTPSSVTMTPGDKLTFAASVNAEAGATDRTVTWSSSNTNVATVDQFGVVTAHAAGTCTIIAASKQDPTVMGAASVTVQAPTPTVATVTISSINSTVMTVGGTNQLSATVSGTNNPSQAVTWNSSSTSVATITQTGLLTAVAPGSTTVTATSVQDPTKSGTLGFTINPLTPVCRGNSTGSFAVVVGSDPAGHAGFIQMPATLGLTFAVSGSTMTVTGPFPFVNVTGSINSSCDINLTGTGTVAGYPNTQVTMTGNLPDGGTVTVTYKMGTNGALPTGQAITYLLTGK